jgi:PST family polysaccharide transporter
VKLAAALALTKLVAVQLGPAGYAAVGQIQNFVAIVTSLGGGLFANGVTRHFAIRNTSDAEIHRARIVKTATTIGFALSLAISVAMIVLADTLTKWLLPSQVPSSILIWTACGLPFIVLNVTLLAAMNGRMAIASMLMASVAGTLLYTGLSIVLVMKFGLVGALISTASGSAIALVATVFFYHRLSPGGIASAFGKPNLESFHSLSQFALMAAVSAFTVPLALLITRQQIALHLGIDAAGQWQAMWKLSETHLMLLTTTLSVYFLPRLSAISSSREIASEVAKGTRVVLCIVLCTSCAIFFAREQVVLGLFSSEFTPVTEVIGWQLLGDILKIGSWVTAYTMLSHQRTKQYISTEIIFAIVLCGILTLATMMDGLRGVAIGYAITYALYWITVSRLFTGLRRDMSKAELQQSQ